MLYVQGRNLIRNALFIGVFFFISSFCYSTTYYFSSTDGDDSRNSIEARDPETPWKTLNKLNSVLHSLSPGDTVFLKRGNTFFGTIQLRTSGTEQAPIVVSAYGEGELPIISGWTTIEKWRPVGNGIYKSDHIAALSKFNLLVVDETPQPLGRYPDEGYHNYKLGQTANALVVENDYSSLDLEGSQLVVRKNQWVIDKHPIKIINGREIQYLGESSYAGSDGYGLFIQDNIELLSVFGEWYHDLDQQAVFIYAGEKSPSPNVIKVSTVDHLLTNAFNVQHIVIENLHFTGGNQSGIYLSEAGAIEVRGCVIEYSGENAVTALNVPMLSLTDNRISYSQNNGINLRYGTPHARIVNNTVTNTHLLPGMGLSGDGNGIGIYSVADDGYIFNNRVINTGYSGIVFNGDRTVVKNNYIDSYCLVKNDGGGIYTYEGHDNRRYQDRKVEGNIIVNGKGTQEGAGMSDRFFIPQVEGIYIDDNANGIEIINNSIGNVSRNALNIHNARNIVVSNNTMYNGHRQVFISHDTMGDEVRDIRIYNNLLFASSETQVLIAVSSIKDDVEKMAVFQDNLYLRPQGNEYVFQVHSKKSNGDNVLIPYSFAQWTNRSSINDLGSTEQLVSGYSFSANNLVTSEVVGAKELVCLDGNCSQESYGRTAVINTIGTSSGVKINLGSIDPLSQYLLRLQVSTQDSLLITTALRHSKAPWTYLSESTSFDIEPGTHVVEKAFSFPKASSDGAAILTFHHDINTLTIHDIEWLMGDITYCRPETRFEYNEGAQPKVIELRGDYLDVLGNPIPKQLVLPPYSSKILIGSHNP